MKVKTITALLLSLLMLLSLMVGCNQGTGTSKETGTTTGTAGTTAGSQTEERPKVTIEVVATQPEYLDQEKEIWNLYQKDNPNVTIDLISINEDQITALNARIAAGNPPDIQSTSQFITKENYKNYLNLLTIDYPYWDKFTYDAKNFFKSISGISEDYVPLLNINLGFVPTFIYYADEMEKTGLKPQEIKTFDDLDNFLAGLKDYIDKTKSYDYVLNIGWHPVFSGTIMPTVWGAAMSDLDTLGGLWNGTVKWTDLEKNPLVPYFTKMKEYYDKGYLPKRWYTRNWETDYEASFISKKSILAYHGPWLWDKVLQNNPSAKLAGFPLPANKNGSVHTFPMTPEGTVMFAANVEKENFKETVRAFNWYNSPEIVKMRTSITNLIPAMDLKDAGGPALSGPQYTGVIKPVIDGAFGNIKLDGAQWPSFAASKFEIPGKPPVMEDDAMAAIFGQYFDGKLSLEQFMATLQKRFDEKYKFN